MGFRSGLVAIVGRPNVGKSTLLNALLGRRLAIVTPRPQTTRNRIMGIATWPDCQVLFLDTPGIHEARGNLNRLMVETALASMQEADSVCLVLDATEEIGRAEFHPGNAAVLERVEASALPALLVLNKVDLVRSKELLLPVISRYCGQMAFRAALPVSALGGEGIPALVAEVRGTLPEGAKIFGDSELTDRSLHFIVSEFIREQAFLMTREEVPYSTAVSVDLVDEPAGPEGVLRIVATIHVERKSQKGILVGRGGSMIREIGTRARREIEGYLFPDSSRKTFIELHVRVEPDWSRSAKGLRKVGFEP